MIVLDASVIIAVLNPSDSHHSQARSILNTHAAGGYLVHQMTLAEVLVDPVRLGRAAQRMSELELMGVRAAQPDEREPLQLAELRASTGLRLPDCCVLVAATRGLSPLATFDARLERAALALGLQVVAA